MTNTHTEDKDVSQLTWTLFGRTLTRTWVRTILMSGAPERLIDRAGEGSTFREMRQLATWIL